MTSTTKDFNVAIVGGGMCGLALAIALARTGIDVNVFEAATKLGEVGAGVGLGPNALRALKGLGLFDAVLKAANEPGSNMPFFRFISGMGDHDHIYDYVNSAKDEEDKNGLGIYRPAFLDALAPLIHPGRTHFNKRCVSIEQSPSGRRLLRFEDRTTFEADLVVGADGIKSVTRKVIIGDDSSCLRFSDTAAYRGLVPMHVLKESGLRVDIGASTHVWVGLGSHLITFPMKNGTLLNVAAFVQLSGPEASVLGPELPQPWVKTVPQQELLDGYQGWGDDALTILKHIKAPSRWSIHTLHPPLESFVSGRVVLVGDAAHGMLPHLAAGVGQGFEDVYMLYKLLTLPLTTNANLETVLAVYDGLRPPRANMVLLRSISAGKLYGGFGDSGYSTQEMVAHLTGLWDPVWFYNIVDEVSDAIREMEKKL